MSLLSRALELSSLCIDVCNTPQCDTASKSCCCRRPAGLFGSTRYLRGESKSAEFPSTAMRSWDISGYRSELMPVGGALHAGIEARSRAAGLSQFHPRSDRSLGLRSRVELRRSSRLPEAPQTAKFAHVLADPLLRSQATGPESFARCHEPTESIGSTEELLNCRPHPICNVESRQVS